MDFVGVSFLLTIATFSGVGLPRLCLFKPVFVPGSIAQVNYKLTFLSVLTIFRMTDTQKKTFGCGFKLGTCRQ